MSPCVPEEVDVFSVPHLRMKELVDDYYEKLQTTNFSNVVDLQLLLDRLSRTFVEFKTHEQIENRLIMKRLKLKLNTLSINNSAVCNCHKDSRLADMLQLLRDGFTKKTIADRQNYGLLLKNSLEDFTNTFLPHMKEEEEVFQPLLQQVFSYEELCELKQTVITQHLLLKEQQLHVEQLACQLAASQLSTDSLAERAATPPPTPPSPISDLPTEVLLHVFSYLNVRELARCAQTCLRWSQLAFDPSLWPQIHPVQWAQGDWSFADHRPDDVDSDDDDEYVDSDEDDYLVIDDDADVDESCDMSEGDGCSRSIQQILREAKILTGLVKNVLPKVGQAVHSLILANCNALTNGMLHRILQYCPNVELLDITQTRISDAGLKSLSRDNTCSSLKQLILSGCVNIGDVTLVRLSLALSHHRHHHPSSSVGSDDRCQSPSGGRRSPMSHSAVDGQRSPTSHWRGSATEDCLCLQYYKEHRKNLNEMCPISSAAGSVTEGTDVVYCSDDVARCRLARVGAGLMDEGVVGGQEEDRERSLEYLDLSGCFLITDLGIRALAGSGHFVYLQLLDLSGCMKLSASALHELVAVCPRLRPHQLFYCDNIVDGPFTASASGCRNLQCVTRMCCRSGN